MPSILFVCTGNQCRSPVAARLFETTVRSTALSTWRIESAGVWATTGRGVPTRLLKVAQRLGIDLQSHRARSIEAVPNLADFDLILTMERTQRESLQVEFPAIAGRIHLLSSLAGPGYDIADPMGGSDEDYQLMIDELRQLIARALPEIVKLVEHFPHAKTLQTSIAMALDQAY